MSAWEIGQLTQQLYNGFMGYAAMSEVLEHRGIADVLNQMRLENSGPASVPVGKVARSSGSEIAYHLVHYAENVATTDVYRRTYERLWLAGALLELGDRLGAENYLGAHDGPDLQFVRHLRNGVAHGNRFTFKDYLFDDDGSLKSPAHFTGAHRTTMPDGSTRAEGSHFEIHRGLEGEQVLFDYIGPGDVCDLLQFIGNRLIRIGNGDPARDLWPQRA